MNRELQTLKANPLRVLLLAFLIAGLGLIFIFQNTDYLSLICQCQQGPAFHFIVNKAVRVLANDVCVLGIIAVWFDDRDITRMAFWLQMLDTFFLLPIYLMLKLSIEGDSEISNPLLSQFHRLIVNPTIMVLFIPAIYFQRLNTKH